jgi:hypothetical protein
MAHGSNVFAGANYYDTNTDDPPAAKVTCGINQSGPCQWLWPNGPIADQLTAVWTVTWP